MLIPLTRESFEELIPIIATGPQYAYFWGKFSDLLKRLLISVVGVLVLLIIANYLAENLKPFLFIIGIFMGLYWLWGPIFDASRRNAECRRYKYSGLWQGKVFDVFVTEELVGTQETVNSQGELVLVENLERRLNLEVGDKSGPLTILQVPLQKEHKGIAVGEAAQMVVMSNLQDLSRINKVSDIYLPRLDLWVSDYPYLRRDIFRAIGDELRAARRRKPAKSPKNGDRLRSP
jgi:hypothetical protein